MPPRPDFVEEVHRASKAIKDPVEKLRFIRESLERQKAKDAWVQRVPLAPVRSRLYTWLRLDGIHHLLGKQTPFGAAPEAPPPSRGLAASRALVALAAMVIVLAAAAVGWRAARPE